MELVGYSENISGTTIDLSKLGTNEFRERKRGISYTFELLKGDELVRRKGVRKKRGTLTGNNYLNFRYPNLGWSDPQTDLDTLEDFAGEVAELKWNHGGSLGHWYVDEVEINRRELRDPANDTGEDFMAFEYTLALIETPVEPAATPVAPGPPATPTPD